MGLYDYDLGRVLILLIQPEIKQLRTARYNIKLCHGYLKRLYIALGSDFELWVMFLSIH